MIKKCYRCKQEKSIEEFHRHKRESDGYRGICKQCVKLDSRKYYDTHYDEIVERVKVWQQNNREKVYEKTKKYKQTENGKEQVRLDVLRRRSNIKNRISTLTKDDIGLLLAIQGNKCCRCGRTFSSEIKRSIDHVIPLSKGGDLTFNNVQLLCVSCNSRKFTNNIMYRQTLAQYWSEVT